MEFKYRETLELEGTLMLATQAPHLHIGKIKPYRMNQAMYLLEPKRLLTHGLVSFHYTPELMGVLWGTKDSFCNRQGVRVTGKGTGFEAR